MGVEAVIDKDLASELLARDLNADLYIMATDATAVFVNWGKPDAKAIHRANPKAMQTYQFPAGSMGPKGRCRLPLRRGDGEDCRDRCAR